MQARHFIQTLVCPDCKNVLAEVIADSSSLGFVCSSCKMIFPLKDGILILLGKNGRNYKLEYELITEIRKEASMHQIAWISEYVANTLRSIELSEDANKWEWEDEAFWDATFRKREETGAQKNWNDRIWQRMFLTDKLINETTLRGKVILDLGCGEGQVFRSLLSHYCDTSTLYVACDISFEGLKLNRLLNTHTNSLYVLSSGDKLPFHSRSADIICYFGLLHHLKGKASSLGEGRLVLKSGGYILIHEALERMSVPLLTKAYAKANEKSAHEETISKEALLRQVSDRSAFRILAKREIGTVFFTCMMAFLRNLMINHKWFFHRVTSIDMLLIRLFGRMLPWFEPNQIMLLVQELPAVQESVSL